MSHMRGRTVLGIAAGCVATAAIVFGATAAHAGGPESVGKQLYLKYCGSCHGAGGKGDGVVATFMRPKPTDLTQLAKQAGGEFPYLHTIQVIDGRQAVRAHGDPDMPVWGELFQDQGSDGMRRRAEVQGKLMLITDYLRSIQEKGEK